MEITKVKILLEDYISREKGYSYGKFTTDHLNVNVFITQDIKDMGMFTDFPFLKYDKNLRGAVSYSLNTAPTVRITFDLSGGIFSSTP